MDVQIAINTLLSLMALIFPGFLFRRFYYRHEFTKQFNQTSQFDALVLNIVFSVVLIGITILSVKIFMYVTDFNILENLTYEHLPSIMTALLTGRVPEKNELLLIYEDIIWLSISIYFFSAFLGFFCSSVVIRGGLDRRFATLRFKNYWYYYIHGGSILYKGKAHKCDFTVADVLCEVGSQTVLYSGVVSQYTIDKDTNALENIFLADAIRYKGRDEQGNVITKPIPGAATCLPASKIININFTYFAYPKQKRSIPDTIKLILNGLFLIGCLGIITSVFFNLTAIGVDTLLKKIFYILIAIACWASFKTFLEQLITWQRAFKQSFFVFLLFLDFLRYPTNLLPYWNNWIAHLIISIGCLYLIGKLAPPPKTDNP